MRSNKTALFLPFMQITTGHHHVADALMDELQKINDAMDCQKVDILSYSYGSIEKLVSSTYLFWIKRIPQTYHWLYDQMAYKEVPKRNRQLVYEAIFMYFFKRLLKQTEPAVLFCTHSLPSHLAGRLKKHGKLHAVTVNVYTDYFINRIWGIDGIDFHMVPSAQVKEFLIRNGVKEETIFVTGIPVHEAFVKGSPKQLESDRITVLVSGGSLGVVEIDQFLPSNASDKKLHYYVLCGKNERLYEQLGRRKLSNVTPISYISCKKEMNQLYDKVDAVLTKPGGVTVSECLWKRKTVFICNALPGQEKINAAQLKDLGVIIPINTQEDSVEEQIINYFSDDIRQQRYRESLEGYHGSLEKKSMAEILKEILY